jgi:hypothetical protein
MNLRLRMQHTEIDLPDGELLIGRSPSCRVRIDHPAISRRHAKMMVLGSQVELEDLGSRNGVFVNGERLQGRQTIQVGDRIAIGNAEFQLVRADEPNTLNPERTTGSIAVQRCPHCNRMFPSVLDQCPSCRVPALPSPSLDEFAATTSTSDGSFHVLSGVGDKALQMGRVEEAELLIGRNLKTLLTRVQGGERLDAPLFEDSCRRAMRLANATRRADWIVWLFDFGTAQEMVLPAFAIDDLHSLMFGLRPDLGSSLDAYIARLSSRSLVADEPVRMKRVGGLKRFTKASPT